MNEEEWKHEEEKNEEIFDNVYLINNIRKILLGIVTNTEYYSMNSIE